MIDKIIQVILFTIALISMLYMVKTYYITRRIANKVDKVPNKIEVPINGNYSIHNGFLSKIKIIVKILINWCKS